MAVAKVTFSQISRTDVPVSRCCFVNFCKQQQRNKQGIITHAYTAIALIAVEVCLNQYGGTTATTEHICLHCRALYGACSKHILLQRSPGHLSESGYHRKRVDRHIRFEYATCGRSQFLNRKEKVADSKISGYMWTWPKPRGKLRQGWPGDMA